MRYLKTIVLSLCILLGCGAISHAQMTPEQMEKVYEELDAKLDEYFEAIKTLDTQQKIEEVDFLISTCEDSLIRQRVALQSYSHYMTSPVMGDEAIPVHLTDTWFATGKIKMLEEFDLLNAMVYAEFNRQSLLGCKAQPLAMETFEGDSLTVLSGGAKRYRIVYFYDTGCAKCKLQSPLMTRALSNLDYPVDLYCIYTGASRESWENYLESNFHITAENVRVYNLWDATRSSDFERKYGVLQTPRMFLVDRSGTIIGRGLDTEALITLLSDVYKMKDYQFAQQDSQDLYDTIFAEPTETSLSDMADYIRESTLAKGDTLTFKMMSGDLLYWLSSQRSEVLKMSSRDFIRKNITEADGIWLDSWDTLKVVGLGQMMDELLSKSEIGQSITSIKVPGRLITSKGEKSRKMNLSKMKGNTNYIIFHTSGCSICEEELSAARKLIAEQTNSRNIHVFAVNVDEVMDSSPDLSGRLFDSFDLSGLPFMLQTDRKGTVLRKYLSLKD